MTFGKVDRLVDLRIEKERRTGDKATNEQDPDLVTPAFRSLKRLRCNHKKLGCDEKLRSLLSITIYQKRSYLPI
jgi:hypothetical protein